MKCNCGRKTRVVSTVFPKRYRKCDTCNKRFSTIEIHSSALKIIKLQNELNGKTIPVVGN